jgi:hypothetical protein
MNVYDDIQIIFNYRILNMKMKVITNVSFDYIMVLLVFEFFFSVVDVFFFVFLIGIEFFLVGGGPRQISNRETHLYSEINDSITLLCPIFSAIPAWYTFIIPKDSVLVGNDYLRIKHVSDSHSGMYTCRVTTNEENEGYSLTSNFYLDVYGKIFELY